jgi:hypothetical protein
MKVYTPADMSDDICMGLSTNIYMDMRCRQGHECLPLHGYDMEISCSNLPNLRQGPCLSPWCIFWYHFRHPSRRPWAVNKSSRWVHKVLSQEQMNRRVETSAAFMQLIQNEGMSFLGKIITIDESAVSMHTPTMKYSQNSG